ncbi:XRE family transcriptional regulator [Enterococcus termitis]|uniref:Cro/Cl family transcriptional regulator n=1 Tax=Enterococcus termitis TaxID=332950 RepID=A0A1E5GCY2_9ENTE|nr:XRE family transcriptional regulator [Enterococcus termitis]OEG10511.1 Cro/Cl family transcriptional regulator [Enterococcus termitis]OJG97502.1 Cro/Cl family transcriptional regulator [Enterococcus termitis]
MHGKEVKKLRTQLGLTQQTFAEKISIPRTVVSKIENNHRPVSSTLLAKLKKNFHLDGGLLTMEAKIDFLRVRFQINSPDLVIEKVLRMDSNAFMYKDYGFYHYTETYCFSEIFVFFNPNDIHMGVMIELRGQGCREYELILEEYKESWSHFFWRLYQDNLFENGLIVDTKITRIDIALDEKLSPFSSNYDLYELKEKYEQGLVNTTFRNFDFRGGFVQKNGKTVNKGLSLYFGSRQSPMYLNFYQKDYELAKKEEISVEQAQEKYGIKNRYEVRLADEKAYLFVEYLLSTGETLEWVVKELIDTSLKVYDCDEEGNRISYSKNWRQVIESMQELRLTIKGEKPNYEKSLRWLSNYLAPTLKKIWLIDQTLGKNELMDRIQRAKLKEIDEEAILTITTSLRELIIQETAATDTTPERISVTKEEIEQLLASYLFI